MEKVNDNNYLEKFLQRLKEDMINCMHNLAKFKKKKTVNPCNVLVIILYVVNSQLIESLLLALSFFYQFIFFFFMGNACVQ